jgi:folate-dependent phosphoribosylglycinamide formyltransferase PurN
MWVALFSNSGSELAEVCERLGRYPDRILVDKIRTTVHSDIDCRSELLSHKEILEELKNLPDDAIVTLHGYLRIINGDSIKESMYNVHPGDIIKYPELVGIHPQRKAIDLKLPSTGVVIHKVTDELDGGEIQLFVSHDIEPGTDENKLIKELRDISIKMWMMLLRGKV